MLGERILQTKERSQRDATWIRTPLAMDLLEGKYVLSILVATYELQAITTSDLIRYVDGRPSAVIHAVRVLEQLGVLNRRLARKGRRTKEIRLTLKGLQLVDTSIHHWGRLLRKWDTLRA